MLASKKQVDKIEAVLECDLHNYVSELFIDFSKKSKSTCSPRKTFAVSSASLGNTSHNWGYFDLKRSTRSFFWALLSLRYLMPLSAIHPGAFGKKGYLLGVIDCTIVLFRTPDAPDGHERP